MSWSAAWTTPGEPVFSPPYEECGVEVREQIEAAQKCVEAILGSACVGKPDKVFSIQIGGHANADHEPTAEWSNDYVNVRVYQENS